MAPKGIASTLQKVLKNADNSKIVVLITTHWNCYDWALCFSVYQPVTTPCEVLLSLQRLICTCNIKMLFSIKPVLYYISYPECYMTLVYSVCIKGCSECKNFLHAFVVAELIQPFAKWSTWLINATTFRREACVSLFRTHGKFFSTQGWGLEHRGWLRWALAFRPVL